MRGGVACRRVTVRGRSNSNSNSRDEAGVKAAVLTHLSCDLKNKGAAGGRQQLYAVIRRHVTVVPLCWKLGSLGGTNTEALSSLSFCLGPRNWVLDTEKLNPYSAPYLSMRIEVSSVKRK